MGLDGLRRAAHADGFDDIGIERALHKVIDAALLFADLFGLFVEYGDEFGADEFALLLAVGHTFEFGEETGGGVDRIEIEAEVAAKMLLDFGEFILTQDAVVHEYTMQAVADSAMHQHGGDGGILTAGERADGAAGGADFFLDGGDGLGDELLRRPITFGAADVKDEIVEQFPSARRVMDLRMELDGPDAAGFVLHSSQRVRCARYFAEAGW